MLCQLPSKDLSGSYKQWGLGVRNQLHRWQKSWGMKQEVRQPKGQSLQAISIPGVERTREEVVLLEPRSLNSYWKLKWWGRNPSSGIGAVEETRQLPEVLLQAELDSEECLPRSSSPSWVTSQVHLEAHMQSWAQCSLLWGRSVREGEGERKEGKQMNEAQMRTARGQAKEIWEPFQIGISLFNKEYLESLERDMPTIIEVTGPRTNEVKLMTLLFMHDSRNQSFLVLFPQN